MLFQVRDFGSIKLYCKHYTFATDVTYIMSAIKVAGTSDVLQTNYFPTHIFNGEENHHLCCVFFLPNSAKTPLWTNYSTCSLAAFTYYFPTHIFNGEENHHLCCVFFLPNSAKTPLWTNYSTCSLAAFT